MTVRSCTNPSRSLGDISIGIELFKIFLSVNRIAILVVESAAPANIPLQNLTSLILWIGKRWGRKN